MYSLFSLTPFVLSFLIWAVLLLNTRRHVLYALSCAKKRNFPLTRAQAWSLVDPNVPRAIELADGRRMSWDRKLKRVDFIFPQEPEAGA